MSTNKSGFFGNLKNDLPAGIVVFLVAMPLCLGIALASGAPLFSGIIAGIVGGVVVSLISGSPLGVSGPAAGLAVIVLQAIQDLGSFELFLVAVVIAGFFQIILGILKFGVIGYYFPNSVIKGMLAGIGIIIILKQIPHALGYDKDPSGDWSFFQTDGHTTLSELGFMLDNINWGAVIISCLAMGILILWDRPFMKKIGLFKIVQGALVVVASGILINLLYQQTGWFTLAGDELVSIPVATNFNEFKGLFTFPDWTAFKDLNIIKTGAIIALVASLETLLCVEATDKLDPQKRVTPTNRELIAQGTGNMISGFIGGLPITQVIVRSSANIQSGGKTKASAFFHGILLLVSALSIPFVLNLIPYASLAAILFIVGYKLAKPSMIIEMYKKGGSEFIPFAVTVIAIVFTDLLVGISLGLVVAIVHVLWQNYKMPYHFHPEEHEEGKPVRIALSEQVTFLNKVSIMKTLNDLPDGTSVEIDARKMRTAHPDVLEIIEDFKENAKTRDIIVTMLMPKRKDELNSVKKFENHVTDQNPN